MSLALVLLTDHLVPLPPHLGPLLLGLVDPWPLLVLMTETVRDLALQSRKPCLAGITWWEIFTWGT